MYNKLFIFNKKIKIHLISLTTLVSSLEAMQECEVNRFLKMFGDSGDVDLNGVKDDLSAFGLSTADNEILKQCK